MTIFLNVPYAEKDEARALGARWNPTRKRWYVPDGTALEPFEKWASEVGAPAGKSGGRVDSAVAKLAVGANFVELGHDCNPFESCAECQAALSGGTWLAARSGLLATVAGLGRGR